MKAQCEEHTRAMDLTIIYLNICGEFQRPTYLTHIIVKRYRSCVSVFKARFKSNLIEQATDKLLGPTVLLTNRSVPI